MIDALYREFWKLDEWEMFAFVVLHKSYIWRKADEFSSEYLYDKPENRYTIKTAKENAVNFSAWKFDTLFKLKQRDPENPAVFYFLNGRELPELSQEDLSRLSTHYLSK